MKNRNIIYLCILLLAISCGKKQETGHEGHGHNEHGHDEHAEHSTTEVVLTIQQQKLIKLKTGLILRKPLATFVYANGELELPPNDKADVSSLVGGVIKKVRVIEGSKVAKGQILAHLEHPEIVQMQQDYLSHLNELIYLQKEKKRQEILYKEKVGSGKNLQKVTANYRATLANVEGLKAKLRMLGLSPSRVEQGKIYPSIYIKSPIKGVVSLVQTNIGAFVQPQNKLFEVVNNDDLHVALKVYEKDIAKVKVGQKIIFEVSNNGKKMEGEVFAISPAFENNPRAVHIHAHIHAEKMHLLSGMYVKGKIVVGQTDSTTVLPEEAVVTDKNRTYVFVKKQVRNHGTHAHDDHHHGHGHEEQRKSTFTKTEVILGQKEKGFVEIKFLKKMAKETVFATSSAYYLLAEMTKEETEHTH